MVLSARRGVSACMYFLVYMCYYFSMQHLSYHNPNPWPVFIQKNDLKTGLFLRTCPVLYWNMLYWVWWNTDGCWWQKVWRAIVCTSRGSGVLYTKKIFVFSTRGLKWEHFLKQIFGYTAYLRCALIDRIWSVKYFIYLFYLFIYWICHHTKKKLHWRR
jgi:hypothetical protein